MIIANPDEQVWKMLTGGAGSSKARAEMDALKRQLKERGVLFVVDRDEREQWVRLRSRRDLRMIQIKADCLSEDALLEVRYGGAVTENLDAAQAMALVLDYYGEAPAETREEASSET